MPPRLQLFFLRLLNYDYVLEFVPGKELLLADMLSRSPPIKQRQDISGSTEEIKVHAIGAVSDWSNFPAVGKLSDTTSRTIIAKLSCIFGDMESPLRYDFRHVKSSPGFPQSNELAEKGVQIVKRIMKKTQENCDDFWLGMLSYRSTPLEDGHSPGELLQDRRLQTRVPDFIPQTKYSVFKRRQLDSG
ncbi:uncharacterized protein LOC142790986 [Rhipicephalus microplus]|uniref:uncharacterized protein LOC142790986 n=1 Tax=Rhipicephalus microplus TaxID=6941 RepID=UPI003F6C8255